MILIVAPPDDVHAISVAAEVERLGKTVRLLDTGGCGQSTLVAYPLSNHGRSGRPVTITTEAGPVLLDEIESVWYRRSARPNIPETVLDPEDRRFAEREWGELLDAVFLSLSARFVNPLLAQRTAVKPRQLRLAREAGLRIPDTLITNDPAEVDVFLASHKGRVVHKALSAPQHTLVDTRRWSSNDRIHLGDLPLAPTIFQEEITGHTDLRIVMVGQEVFAAQFEPERDLADSRFDVDVPWKIHDLPESVRSALLNLMAQMGLVYGAIDMRIDDRGEYVFFEVNPQGQFLYVEILTGLPITSAMAKLLAGNDAR